MSGSRGNFCADQDKAAHVTDRHAGPIPTEFNAKLVELLRAIQLPGIQTFVETVKEYRFVLVLRPSAGQTLHAAILDTDPQQLGVPSRPARAEDEQSETTAALVNGWIAAARGDPRSHAPANSLNLRGFAKDSGTAQDGRGLWIESGSHRHLSDVPRRSQAGGHGRAAGEWGNGRGRSRDPARPLGRAVALASSMSKKPTRPVRMADFDRKAEVIEHVDRTVVPAILGQDPDVLIVTGDHWPSVSKKPLLAPCAYLLWSRYCLSDRATGPGGAEFGERACGRGSLGVFPATDELPLALGHALASRISTGLDSGYCHGGREHGKNLIGKQHCVPCVSAGYFAPSLG